MTVFAVKPLEYGRPWSPSRTMIPRGGFAARSFMALSASLQGPLPCSRPCRFDHSVEGGWKVSVHGELWNAVARTSLPEGTRIRVSAVDGLQLIVEAAD